MAVRYHRLIKILVFFLALGIGIFIMSRGRVYAPETLEWGATFSAKQARAMGLDPRTVLGAALSELGLKRLRLAAYWDESEPVRGEYRWEDTDWQIDLAGTNGATVILALGARLPRWPECHYPDWTDGLDAAEEERALFKYIEATVEHYRARSEVVAWQIENEPFLAHFGECPPLDPERLDREIALVRRLDPSRPIVVTDSGELSLWVPAARRADIFGTSLYRDTYSKQLGRYIHYPITPGFFRLKRNITGLFAQPKDWILIELQAEPWAPTPYWEVTPAERARTMDLEKFRAITEFARQAGFQKMYLWGVEWWYWEKTVNGNDDLWLEAIRLIGSGI